MCWFLFDFQLKREKKLFIWWELIQRSIGQNDEKTGETCTSIQGFIIDKYSNLTYNTDE